MLLLNTRINLCLKLSILYGYCPIEYTIYLKTSVIVTVMGSNQFAGLEIITAAPMTVAN